MKRLFCLLALLACFTLAGAQEIRNIDIQAELQRDGGAWLTVEWDVDIHEGTEWYVPIENLGPMSVENLSVSENGYDFESVGDGWNTSWTRARKRGMCGIIRKRKGVELCWGIGDYGHHVWTVRYHLSGLVQALDDADAFNFQFVNPGMIAAPEHVKLTITPAFDCPEWTYDNTRVWAFGYYGDINVEKGRIVAESSESFSSRSSLIALVKFEKGMFAPSVVRGGEFQDMLDRALEGSSYGEKSEEFSPWMLVFAVFFVFVPIFSLIYILVASACGYKWKKSIFGKKKIEGWYRDVPLNGNLFAAAYTLAKGSRFSLNPPGQSLIGAFFLRWIMDGKVTVQPEPGSSKRVNLSFHATSVSSDDVEEDLFQMARIASGDNLLLEKGEFEKYSTKNYKKVMAWPDRAVRRGGSWFKNNGLFLRDDVCNAAGAAQACHVIEFRNFLKDFTLSRERAAFEVNLWKDYLVYAQLFGIADKVAAQFKKLYPAEFGELAQSTGLDSTSMMYTLNWTNHMTARSFNNAVAKAGSVSGGGGHSSFGGGGGFSGGGFGGGAR